MLVYDPINLEKLQIKDYINNDNNNIVIIYNKKAYGINKSLFMFNNEMKKCILMNNALLKKATYDNPETFYNIGYFIGKNVIVNLNKLNNILKEHKIIELTSKTTGDTYINKELLELTTIGLIKPSNNKNSIGKVNFKYAYEDVYFEELISHFLHEYSGSLYTYINYSLLNPDYYNNDLPLEYYLKSILTNVFKVTKFDNFKNRDFKQYIDKAISNIDRLFIEAAPRYEKTYTHKVFYRGMNRKYINTNGDPLENIGDTALILNYTSVSTKKSVAKVFAGNLVGKVTPIYIIYLEEGLPFVNMVSNAKIKKEKEYLLPRNIIFELISKSGREYTVLARPFKKDQFSIKTGCFSLDYYDLEPANISTSMSKSTSKKQSTPLHVKSKSKSKSKTKSKTKSKIDSGKNKEIIIPVKSKRCPKGMVKNKATNECVPKIKNIKQNSNVKLGRCPKGTRRNPKTLQCETK